MSLKYHSADIVVWYPTRSHYSGNETTTFCVEILCRALEKVASPTNLKSLVWLCRELNPGLPSHEANFLSQGYTKHTIIENFNIKAYVTLILNFNNYILLTNDKTLFIFAHKKKKNPGMLSKHCDGMNKSAVYARIKPIYM